MNDLQTKFYEFHLHLCLCVLGRYNRTLVHLRFLTDVVARQKVLTHTFTHAHTHRHTCKEHQDKSVMH
jgi:hypothetical protein